MGKEKQRSLTILNDVHLSVNGVFDINKVREAIAGVLLAKKFFMYEKGSSVRETPEGREYEAEYIAFKKIDDYVKCVITVKFLILRYNEVEVDGKTLGSGLARVGFTAKMDKDWKEKFGSKGFKNMLREIYEKYIIPDKLLSREVQIYKETVDVMNAAKAVMEMNQ